MGVRRIARQMTRASTLRSPAIGAFAAHLDSVCHNTNEWGFTSPGCFRFLSFWVADYLHIWMFLT